RLVLGRAYLIKDDVQRAVVEAEGILALDNKFTEAYLLLGEAYNQLKLCRKSIKVLKTALTLDPYNTFVQERYRAVKERELENEIEKIRQRLAEDEWKMSLRLDLAKLYMQKGLSDEATRELQMVIKDQVRGHLAYNFLGCLSRGQGRFEQAEAQFKKAIELAPADNGEFLRSAKANLGSAYEAQGLIHESLEIYESVIREQMDFANLKKKMRYLKATNLKSLKTKSLLLVFALPAAREVIAVWGRGSKAGRGRPGEMSMPFGHNHNVAGFDYYLKGMIKAAWEEFQLAVQLDSSSASALNNFGVCFVHEGRFAEARQKFAEAVNLEPNSVIFHNNLGVVYLLLGEIEKARKTLEQVSQLDPELAAAQINLGDIYSCKKETQKALALYAQIGRHDVLAELALARLRYRVPE
ncbi:MAG: tetratricopeptide repeat protein, partial [Candidatus Margulisbacteria bacterium]|nr:tetratricopeptide repeat protein [Candidatus Margulisiibacteriota bacterium]